MTKWQKAVNRLLSAALPSCSYCPDRIATHMSWVLPLCRDCAGKLKRSAPDIRITRYPYADTVLDLENDDEHDEEDSAGDS